MNTYQTKSSEETMDIAKELLDKILNSRIVLLHGSLGSGKTTFVKGLAKNLDITEVITSPTYTYLKKYSIPHCPEKRKKQHCLLQHFDLYRLPENISNHEQTSAEIGLEEALNNSKDLVIIEWPERLPKTKGKLNIYFEKLKDSHLISVKE